MAWGLAAILAVLLLGGVGLLGVRLKPYWVAKYRGRNASLHAAILINAPLAGVDHRGGDSGVGGLDAAGGEVPAGCHDQAHADAGEELDVQAVAAVQADGGDRPWRARPAPCR